MTTVIGAMSAMRAAAYERDVRPYGRPRSRDGQAHHETPNAQATRTHPGRMPPSHRRRYRPRRKRKPGPSQPGRLRRRGRLRHHEPPVDHGGGVGGRHLLCDLRQRRPRYGEPHRGGHARCRHPGDRHVCGLGPLPQDQQRSRRVRAPHRPGRRHRLRRDVPHESRRDRLEARLGAVPGAPSRGPRDADPLRGPSRRSPEVRLRAAHPRARLQAGLSRLRAADVRALSAPPSFWLLSLRACLPTSNELPSTRSSRAG
jgi:hypothetical protein